MSDIGVEQIAALRARLDAGSLGAGPSRAEQLESEGLSEKAWQQAEERLFAALADEIDCGQLERLRAYQDTYAQTWQEVTGLELPPQDSIERPEPPEPTPAEEPPEPAPTEQTYQTAELDIAKLASLEVPFEEDDSAEPPPPAGSKVEAEGRRRRGMTVGNLNDAILGQDAVSFAQDSSSPASATIPHEPTEPPEPTPPEALGDWCQTGTNRRGGVYPLPQATSARAGIKPAPTTDRPFSTSPQETPPEPDLDATAPIDPAMLRELAVPFDRSQPMSLERYAELTALVEADQGAGADEEWQRTVQRYDIAFSYDPEMKARFGELLAAARAKRGATS